MVAVLTVAGVLALLMAIGIVSRVMTAIRIQRAFDQVAEQANAPNPPAPVTTTLAPAPAPTVAPVAAAATARLSARDLARQSLPATVSLHCNDSIGSGFFVEPDLILTNAHVLCPPGEKIRAVLSNGDHYTGETVRSSQAVDLALVRLPGAKITPLPLGDVGDLALGDRIMMIGSPVGLEFTVHEGLVSHLGRVVQGVAYIQLDAKVNPGNSGGAIIDEQGRVVGIVTLKQAQAEGIGLAVPINYAYGPPLAYLNPPSPAAAESAVFRQMLADAGSKGGIQTLATEGVSIDVAPLLAAVDYDEYRRLVVRILRVQDQAPRYYEATLNLWSSTDMVCTLTGDVAKWKEVDPDRAGSGVPEDLLRGLKKLGAVHIFMGEAALALQSCGLDRSVTELELVGGNPISNRVYVRSY